MPIDALATPAINPEVPSGISPKAVIFGGSGYDFTPTIGRVTITAPQNLKHMPTGRQFFSGDIVRKYVSGIATFAGLVPNDAPGLNRYNWTYHARFEIAGAKEQPAGFDFRIFTADPDVIDGDKLTSVLASDGTQVSALLPPTVVDNGDGTFDLSGIVVIDNGDGTYTIAA